MSPFRPSFHPQLNPFFRSPQPLSPLSTAFTPNRPLTPLSTAFTQNTGGGVPSYSMSSQCLATAGQSPHRRPLTTFRMNTCESVSKQRTLTIFRMNTYVKPPGGGPTPSRYGPGTSLTEQTGSIPDTARTLATACKTSACHGKRAVLWKKNFALSLNTNGGNVP